MGAISDRVRQFREAKVPPEPADFALAREYLGQGPLLELFELQTPRDVRHAAGTARWLVERGHADRDLIVAALLHDVGKGEQRRWDRVSWVVARRVGLGTVSASTTSRFAVRRAMARTANHAVEGARMTEAAGAPKRVVDLIARHHMAPRADAMLGLLHAADAAS